MPSTFTAALSALAALTTLACASSEPVYVPTPDDGQSDEPAPSGPPADCKDVHTIYAIWGVASDSLADAAFTDGKAPGAYPLMDADRCVVEESDDLRPTYVCYWPDDDALKQYEVLISLVDRCRAGLSLVRARESSKPGAFATFTRWRASDDGDHQITVAYHPSILGVSEFTTWTLETRGSD